VWALSHAPLVAHCHLGPGKLYPHRGQAEGSRAPERIGSSFSSTGSVRFTVKI
jgi:hypothetical protein